MIASGRNAMYICKVVQFYIPREAGHYCEHVSKVGLIQIFKSNETVKTDTGPGI